MHADEIIWVETTVYLRNKRVLLETLDRLPISLQGRRECELIYVIWRFRLWQRDRNGDIEVAIVAPYSLTLELHRRSAGH